MTGRLIAIDYHQVLDIDRFENPWLRLLSDTGVLPYRNCAYMRFLQHFLHKKAGSPTGSGLNQVSVIVLSHINADYWLRCCIQSIEAFQLRVCAVEFTRSPARIAGKTAVLRELLRPSVPSIWCVLIDDRLETVREFTAPGLRSIHIQVKKKEEPTAEELRYQFWSFNSLRETADLVKAIASGEWDDY